MAKADRHAKQWEKFAREDPMWAIASRAEKRGSWQVDEFFTIGRQKMQGVLASAREAFPRMGREAALDFGCGLGRLTVPLLDEFNTATGVDVAPTMVEQARSLHRSGRIEFVLNQRDDLRIFEDATFDFVHAHLVLQHIRPELSLAYIAEFGRVLKPGGGLVFTLPHAPARTLRGLAYQVLPRTVIYAAKRRRDGSVMEMNSLSRSTVIGHARRRALEVIRICDSTSAGPNWRSTRYFFERTSSAPAP